MLKPSEKSFYRNGKLIVPWRIEENTFKFKKYDVSPGTTIELLTPTEVNNLAEGTEVYSIFGEKKVKGKDEIDLDTRGGMTAFGLIADTTDYEMEETE